MGANKSALNKLGKCCTCGSKNDYIDDYNVQKCKMRNMSPKQSTNYDIKEFEISVSTFQSETTPYPIPLDPKTMALLMHIEDMDSISPQKLAKTETSEYTSDTSTSAPSEMDETTREDIDVKARLTQIEKISNTGDISKLKKIINHNYGVHSNDNSLNQSSFSLKPDMSSFSLDPKANIYRDGTNTPWTDNDIDELSFEMHQQLLNLINNNIIVSNESNNNMCEDILSDDEDVPSSHLFRPASKEKWSKHSLDIQRKQIKKEMLHLAMAQSP